MQSKNTPQKQEWQAPQLEVIETEETQSGTIQFCFEETWNNLSGQEG